MPSGCRLGDWWTCPQGSLGVSCTCSQEHTTQRTRTHAHTHTGILHMANKTTLETHSTCILVWAYIAALEGDLLSNGRIARGLPNPRKTCSLVARRRSFYAAGTARQTHITCHSCKHNTNHSCQHSMCCNKSVNVNLSR